MRIRDALWRARTNRATPIHAGDSVRVVSVEGVVLEVETFSVEEPGPPLIEVGLKLAVAPEGSPLTLSATVPP